MNTNELIEKMQQQIKDGTLKIVVADDHRYVTDAATETIQIPLTTREETAKMYQKRFLNPVMDKNQNEFDKLPRLSMYIGQPDTGKTYHAQELAERYQVPYVIQMCRDTLNLETLLETFTLEEGKPVFKESIPLKMLTGTEPCIIIFDEFNTLLTGVMKTTQPLFDDTSKTFEYKGTIYNKNMNCKFIVTLNDRDKGISVVPDAILSRACIHYFPPVTPEQISKWTNVPLDWIELLQQVYKLIGLQSIFGTRQVRMIYDKMNLDEIQKHLIGLCRMKNLDEKIVETLQMKQYLIRL